MLKLRSLGINDYSVLEARQRIGRIRFVIERMPGVWLWNVHRPPERRTAAHGLVSGLQHSQGRVQGGLKSPEGQHHAGAAGGGLPGDEHSG